MMVGTLERPGVFKLRSRGGGGQGRRKLSDRAPEAPDRRGHGASSSTGFVEAAAPGPGSRQALLKFAAISAWRPNR